MEAGYTGECYVDNFLKKVTFHKHYAIFKDLHIPVNEHTFLQIDTLIVTPQYIAVLEIKNIRGKISFQRHPYQLIRELNGETTSFKCPEQQLKRHLKNLDTILSQVKINVPIKGLIVFAYSKTHVINPPESAGISMGCDIVEHIEQWNELPSLLTLKAFNKLISYLRFHSTEYLPNPISATYSLEFSQIITGLMCPICHNKISNNKPCLTCKVSKKTMQRNAIEDWFYLVKSTMSNRECVQFLELKDKFAANYLLKTMDLHKINVHRYRHYTLRKSVDRGGTS